MSVDKVMIIKCYERFGSGILFELIVDDSVFFVKSKMYCCKQKSLWVKTEILLKIQHLN